MICQIGCSKIDSYFKGLFPISNISKPAFFLLQSPHTNTSSNKSKTYQKILVLLLKYYFRMNKHHLAKHNEAMTSDRGLRIWMKIALCNFRKKFLTFFSIRIFPVLLLQCCMPAGLDGWNSHVCMSHLLFLIYSYAQALDLDTQWAKIRKKVRYEKCQNKICIDNIRSDIRLVNRVQLSSHLAWIFTIHGTIFPF